MAYRYTIYSLVNLRISSISPFHLGGSSPAPGFTIRGLRSKHTVPNYGGARTNLQEGLL